MFQLNIWLRHFIAHILEIVSQARHFTCTHHTRSRTQTFAHTFSHTRTLHTHTHTHANHPYPWTHFSQTDTGFNTSNNHTLFHSRTHFSYIYKMNTHWVNCCYLFSQYLQPTVKELDARSVSDHLVSVMHWCWERSIHLERANMHCQGIARTLSFFGRLTSAEGQKPECFKRMYIILNKNYENLMKSQCSIIMSVFCLSRVSLCMYTRIYIALLPLVISIKT